MIDPTVVLFLTALISAGGSGSITGFLVYRATNRRTSSDEMTNRERAALEAIKLLQNQSSQFISDLQTQVAAVSARLHTVDEQLVIAQSAIRVCFDERNAMANELAVANRAILRLQDEQARHEAVGSQ